jgi:Ca-activated chloride channel homolog
VLLDVSSSMNQPLAPELTRLHAAAQTVQDGLSLLSDDSEVGLWRFSLQLDGERDWQERVPLGPLGARTGAAPGRRQLARRGYDPKWVNAVVVFTDSTDDDPTGASLPSLLRTLRDEYDPLRPVKIITIGIGDDVDRDALAQIAKATRGSTHTARTPREIQRVLLAAISQRVCAPNC